MIYSIISTSSSVGGAALAPPPLPPLPVTEFFRCFLRSGELPVLPAAPPRLWLLCCRAEFVVAVGGGASAEMSTTSESESSPPAAAAAADLDLESEDLELAEAVESGAVETADRSCEIVNPCHNRYTSTHHHVSVSRGMRRDKNAQAEIPPPLNLRGVIF